MKFVLPVRRKTVNINLEGELQSLRATRNTLQKSAAIEHIRVQSFRSVLSRNETNVARSSSLPYEGVTIWFMKFLNFMSVFRVYYPFNSSYIFNLS